jgi:hypothetical protein
MKERTGVVYGIIICAALGQIMLSLYVPDPKPWQSIVYVVTPFIVLNLVLYVLWRKKKKSKADAA